MDLSTLTFVAVSFMLGTDNITVFVSNDYIKSNSSGEYVEWSQSSVDSFLSKNSELIQPTPKIIDEIYSSATCKVAPQPMNPGATDTSSAHNVIVNLQVSGCEDLTLIAGHKKDLVQPNISKRTALYGWHKLNGKIIQPYSQVHGEHYRDYSHGFRPIKRIGKLNGKPFPIDLLINNGSLGPN